MKNYVITEGWNIFDITSNTEIELVRITNEHMFLFDNDELHTKAEVEKMIEDAESSLERIKVVYYSNDDLREMLIRHNIANIISDSDLKDLYNEYCERNNYDDIIYDMCELDDILNGTATEILRKIDLDNFDMNEDYFYYTIYGIKSCDYVTDCEGYCEDDIVDSILRNNRGFGNEEIGEILDANGEELLELYKDM